MVKKQGALAVLLILAWLAPTVSAVGIHTHVHLDHGHHGAPAAGMAIQVEHHDHEIPDGDLDDAPLVRVGKQKLAAAALAPVLSGLHIGNSDAPLPRMFGPASDRSRHGPALSIRHCSLLI